MAVHTADTFAVSRQQEGPAMKDLKTTLTKKICAFIPCNVSNTAVIAAFEIMRKLQRLRKTDYASHWKDNLNVAQAHAAALKNSNGYIEDQIRWTDTLYGSSTIQYSGCEIIATYNAFRSVTDHPLSFPAMIREYEQDGMVLSGKFGTSPKAIRDYLERNGFLTEFSTDEKDFDDMGRRCDSLILTMYNDRNDISRQVHTINISKKDREFTAHNVYGNGKVLGPFDSVSDTIAGINRGKARGISLIGISLMPPLSISPEQHFR